MSEAVATETPDRSIPRTMDEIGARLGQVLTGSNEQPQEDSDTEQPSSDSIDAEQQDAALADDAVVDELDADEPEEEQFQDDDDGDLYTVKVDGVEDQVSLNELINGYQRTATFTNRQKKLSEERQALEAERAQLPAQKAELQQTLQQYQQVLHSLRTQMEAANAPANVDWAALEREDPVQWLKLKELERQRAGEIQAVVAEQQRMHELMEAERVENLQKHLAVERTKMVEVIPEWADSEVQASDQRKLMEYGRDVGFSETELNELYDHRAVRVLRDAMRYRELTQGKKITAAKSKIGSVNAGNRETSRRTRSRQRKAARAKLKQTGKVDDAAALLGQMLTN